jgi:hypothetical protein
MRPPSIQELRARIARKRRARQSTARDLVALQDALHAQLRAEIEEARRRRAGAGSPDASGFPSRKRWPGAPGQRRDPGARQRELEL